MCLILGAFEAQTERLVKIRKCNSKSHNIRKQDLVASSSLMDRESTVLGNQRYLAGVLLEFPDFVSGVEYSETCVKVWNPY